MRVQPQPDALNPLPGRPQRTLCPLQFAEMGQGALKDHEKSFPAHPCDCCSSNTAWQQLKTARGLSPRGWRGRTAQCWEKQGSRIAFLFWAEWGEGYFYKTNKPTNQKNHRVQPSAENPTSQGFTIPALGMEGIWRSAFGNGLETRRCWGEWRIPRA